MKKAIALSAAALALASLPLITFAQSSGPINNLSSVGSLIINTINNVIVPVLFAIAFIVFLWGAFDAFILGATGGEAKEKGKNLMLWGLIGFFVMVSVWGLVNILTGTVNFGGSNSGPNGGLPRAATSIGG